MIFDLEWNFNRYTRFIHIGLVPVRKTVTRYALGYRITTLRCMSIFLHLSGNNRSTGTQALPKLLGRIVTTARGLTDWWISELSFACICTPQVYRSILLTRTTIKYFGMWLSYLPVSFLTINPLHSCSLVAGHRRVISQTLDYLLIWKRKLLPNSFLSSGGKSVKVWGCAA